ncbi:MAG: SDR family oxidoreductase [Phycisphaeraceae bacterium]|nr:SDR family oxidoreductase [Phycisphaeraceae bacterium]
MLKLPHEVVSRLRPRLDGRRVCVTGGAGFIGGHLVDSLLSLGASITVIDDLSTSTAEHIAGLIDLEPERVRFVHASILDEAALGEAVVGCELLFHLAAVSSVPRSLSDPERSYAVNAMGTMHVADAARRANVRRIVYSASSSAYGQGQTLPKVETHIPAPVSPYAASKLAGEHVMLAWAKSYGLSTVSLRYFNVFGPRQPTDSAYAAVIAAFSRQLISGQRPVIFGDGQQTRDFTFVPNAVLANLLAATTDRTLEGQVVNVGTGRRITLNELARILAERSGLPHLVPVHQPERPGDVRHSQADLELGRTLLGYEPIVSLEEGLARTFDWYREQTSSPRVAHG